VKSFLTLVGASLLIAPIGAIADQDVPDITVGHVGHDHHLPLYLAALEGPMFKESFGIYLEEIAPKDVYDLWDGETRLARLHFVKVGGGSKMPAAMERGEIEVGLGGVAPVASFVDKGNPFKIICPLQTEGDMLVLRNEFEVEGWQGFVDLATTHDRPLRIGYKAPIAVAKLIFERALAEEGIPYAHEGGEGARVVLINLKAEGSALPSMVSEAIDGFVWNEPHPSLVQAKGHGYIVCELADLPPEGMWQEHPCCCVAATQDALENKREAVKGLLKVILLAVDLMEADKELAAADASRWTKLEPEIEASSVGGITYMGLPSERYVTGMETWASIMNDLGTFTGTLKDVEPAEAVARVVDFELLQEAAEELAEKGLGPLAQPEELPKTDSTCE
jgi:NitT/TauT family transport system substrate-binding protein